MGVVIIINIRHVHATNTDTIQILIWCFQNLVNIVICCHSNLFPVLLSCVSMVTILGEATGALVHVAVLGGCPPGGHRHLDPFVWSLHF